MVPTGRGPIRLEMNEERIQSSIKAANRRPKVAGKVMALGYWLALGLRLCNMFVTFNLCLLHA